jgi:hypothetical protein
MAPSSEAIDLQPVGQANGNILPRSPTLEAQRNSSTIALARRRWGKLFLSLFTVDEVPDELVEEKLKSAILKSKDSERGSLKQLLSAYTRLKHKSGYVVGSSMLRSSIFEKRETSSDGTIGSKVSDQQPDHYCTKCFTRSIDPIPGRAHGYLLRVHDSVC